MTTSSTRVDWAAWSNAILAKVQPRRTAVVVIDLQRDFCSEDGALAALGSDVSPCRTTAEKVAEFLPRIRELVALVAFFRLEYDPTRMSPVQRERLLRDGRPVICAPDSPGSQLFIAPHPDDKVFTKHRYSAFSNGGFVEVLKALSIETLAVTGVDTHICVENTVRDGYDRGYRMLILSDLVATRTSESRRHENALTVMERYFGFVIHSTQFLTLLGANSHEASALPRSR